MAPKPLNNQRPTTASLFLTDWLKVSDSSSPLLLSSSPTFPDYSGEMKRQRLREMDGFFAVTLVIAQIIFLSEVASGKEEVKRGEKVVIMENKTLSIIKRVKVYEAGKDCKQQTEPICNWCSSEEKKKGCINKNCSSFLLDDGMNVSLTVLDASDGCYIVHIFANPRVKKELIVGGHDQLTSAISPEPKSTEPPETVIIVVIIVVITGVIVFIFCRCKKNKQVESDTADDAGGSEENITPRESISGGEPAEGDSREMDEINHSKDQDRLTDVLLDNDMKTQERGKPEHNHIDDDDYYCSINFISDEDDCNSKNYYDSNYCSNDDDFDFDLTY